MYLRLNIKHLRKLRKMNQTALGGVIGVTHVQIGRYESGDSAPPPDKIVALAEYFKVSLDDFMLRDLSREGMEKKEVLADPDPDSPEGELTQKLIDLLEKRNAQYERIIRRDLPEKARELGLD